MSCLPRGTFRVRLGCHRPAQLQEAWVPRYQSRVEWSQPTGQVRAGRNWGLGAAAGRQLQTLAHSDRIPELSTGPPHPPSPQSRVCSLSQVAARHLASGPTCVLPLPSLPSEASGGWEQGCWSLLTPHTQQGLHSHPHPRRGPPPGQPQPVSSPAWGMQLQEWPRLVCPPALLNSVHVDKTVC